MSIECGVPADPGLLVRRGPLLSVDISVPTSRRIASTGVREANKISCNGLVDSGATRSCLDLMLIRGSELPVVGREHVAGIHGIQESNLYMAEISLTELNVKIRGRFIGLPLKISGLPRVLLGRDMLARLQMVYDGPTGSVTLPVSG